MNILVIAGEVSGDLHGAALIKELKKIDKNLMFFGIGGDRMKEEGMEIIYHLNKMAFLGFAEVIKHLPFIRKVQKNLLALVEERKINSIILIDYPGFNLNFAKKLKKNNKKIIYYISPQIWAWGAGRVKKIKKLVDKMLVVFPFEKEFYKTSNVDVEFVGHPLTDRINEYQFITKEELYKKFNLEEGKEILLILPGSRLHEVERIFPDSIEAASKIADKFNLQVIIASPSNIDENLFSKLSDKKNYKIIKSHTYDLMKYSKIGIIKSGTSTLEAGLFELPMVIVYKTSLLTYLIGKKLVRLNNIGMANIISGEEIIPELIQNEASAENIYKKLNEILSDNSLYLSIKNKLKNIKEKLGSGGSSEKAAQSVYSVLKSSNEIKGN